MKKTERIFSGDYSSSMWDDINRAKTKKQLRYALYFVCCRIQELEARMMEIDSKLSESTERGGKMYVEKGWLIGENEIQRGNLKLG